MTRLVSDAITEARQMLQDVAGVRYADAALIGFINDAVLDARSIRPDLFVGTYLTAPTQITVVGDVIPLPDQFFTSLVYYISGRAELRDDEFAVDGRAMTFIPLLSRKLAKGM